jgi:protein-S-isoprenylcysteine O-methyltransferase Ste14
MNFYQISMIIVMVFFYFAYFMKMYLQRKQGIVTNQLGKGNKKEETKKIEKLLSISTIVIVPIELMSIFLNTRVFRSNTVAIIGILIAVLGVIAFITAILTMKDSWRAGIPDDEKTTIITHGIYQFSRNPAFLGFDLLYIGILFTFGNVIQLIFVILAMVLLHLQILEEEKFLPTVFGEEYIQYKKRTGRYFWFI